MQGLADQLTQVLETMAGEKPAVTAQPGAISANGNLTAWTTISSVGDGAKITFAGAADDCTRLGSKILSAAGLDLDDPETVVGTFRETIDQALSGLAHQATTHLGREITVGACRPVADTSSLESLREPWTSFLVVFAGGDSYQFQVNWNESFLSGFAAAPPTVVSEPSIAAVEAVPHSSSAPMPAGAHRGNSTPSPADTKNPDLLFDVELPVCVSFGRAYLQLKDVLKLTTGSIVELNRTVSEPVEVIVNNCVIARGEVVVVEGNFGVRIEEVISRQERLRTLH